jgi:hypothetical protein
VARAPNGSRAGVSEPAQKAWPGYVRNTFGMNRADFQEHKTEWSAAGGAITAVAGGGAIAWWVAASPSHSGLVHWPAFVLLGIAIAGLYLIVAPLIALPPWRRAGAAVKPTSLETWLQRRTASAEGLAKQRPIRSDKWFFRAMEKWDEENAWELMMKVAPDLTDAYRADPDRPEQADGIEPPHSAVEQDAYFGRRLNWLNETLSRLQQGAPVLPKAARKGPSLADELGSLREYGRSLRREIEPTTGYDTVPMVKLNKLMPALLEQRVRSWARTGRALLESKAQRFLPTFDAGPDLPAPSLLANLVPTTNEAQLLTFINSKLEALEAIIRDINRGA